MFKRWIVLVLAASALLSCGAPQEPTAEPGVRVERLIVGGLLYDGSGDAPYVADVGVRDGRIAFIGDAGTAGVTGDETVDASGMWVTPGFVDAHSHAELDRDYGRDAIPYLHQGITTVVLGMDGGGSSDVADRLAGWRRNGIGVNGLHFVGHGHVREAVMGREDRAPSAEELDDMRALVKKAMDEGAFGLSSGLFYVPGTYASTEEVIELARVAAQYEGAIYDTHDRDLGAVYEGVGYEASVREGIRISEEAGLRAIFSHYNLQGAHNFGRADFGVRLIQDARDRGVDVWAAQHPYTATQSNLRTYTIPDWASAGGQDAMLGRFDDAKLSPRITEATEAMLEIRGGAEKILFADPRPDLNGKTLAEVAAQRELSPAEAVRWVLREGNASVMNLDLYDHDNTRVLAQEAWMMTCTDGRTPRPDQRITHPRTFGAFPKKMRDFVFEESVLAPEFVVRSFSGLAADFYGLDDRGYLREGYAADVIVLDPERYRDRATYDDPKLLAEGVVHALVNGRAAISDGGATGELAGMALERP